MPSTYVSTYVPKKKAAAATAATRSPSPAAQRAAAPPKRRPPAAAAAASAAASRAEGGPRPTTLTSAATSYRPPRPGTTRPALTLVKAKAPRVASYYRDTDYGVGFTRGYGRTASTQVRSHLRHACSTQ
eukprot:COSAG01_NODE_3163_length_6477_cov_140.457981_5_plen_129_part_00